MNALNTKEAMLSQRWPRNAPYIYGCRENFRDSMTTSVRPRLFIPKFFMGLFRSTLWMCVQNVKSVYPLLW